MELGREPSLEGVRLVLLDAGHTLLRPEPAVEERYSRTAARFGARAEPAQVRERFARLWLEGARLREDALFRTDEAGTREFWRSFVARVFEPWRSELDFEPFFETLYDEFATPAAWRLFDDARPALERLGAAGLRLAVVSNWDARLRLLLDRLGVAELFEAVVISAEEGYEKPAPAIFERALELLGAEPGEALHVGDSLGDDVVGALGAGLRAVLVDRRAGLPTGWAELEGKGSYLTVGSLLELVEGLEAARPPSRG